MININIAIEEKVDWAKAIHNLRNKQIKEGKGSLLMQVLKIIEPFADKALAAIPLNIIAQILNLLCKDAAIRFAKDFGVNVSDIQIAAQKD